VACNGHGVGLAVQRSRVRLSAISLSCNDPGQVVHTHVPLSPNSIIWCWPKGGDALQLGRSGGKYWQPITGFITSHLWADCLETGISSGPNACITTFTFFFAFIIVPTETLALLASNTN